MKTLDQNEFDKVFRDKMNSYSEMPPEAVFNRLKNNLNNNHTPKSKGINFYNWLIIAAIGITGTIALFTFLNNNSANLIAENLPNLVNESQVVAVNKETIDSKTYLTDNNTTKNNVLNKNSNLITEESKSSNIENNIVVKNEKVILNEIPSNTKAENITVPIKQYPTIDMQAEIIPSTCKMANAEVYLSSTSGQRLQYFWTQFNDNVSVAERKNLKSGIYEILVKNESGQEKKYSINVPDTGSITADFSHYELSLNVGVPIYFTNRTFVNKQFYKNTNDVSFKWYFGDGLTSYLDEPEHSFAMEGEYTVSLVAISSLGCKDSVYKTGFIIHGAIVEMPNVFTPNGDGINDIFKPDVSGVFEFNCTIFNRNGEKVYEWNSVDGYWDGKILNTDTYASNGVYYYVINAVGSNGRPIVKKGFVQLFR